MTRVIIERKKGHIVKVTAGGHSGYADEGSDIICAALSTLAQTALLGLIQVAGIETDFERTDGFLCFSLPEIISESRRDADMILETMALGIADIYEGYSDYIELEEKTCL